MTTFANASKNQTTRTTNGMKTRKTSANYVLDLFYKVAASRGKDITQDFSAALGENKELALRVAAWARDVRGGAGERQIFRQILGYLQNADVDAADLLMSKIPELGRWDDLFVVKNPALKMKAFGMIKQALSEGNGLAAKWCPRKGEVAVELRNFLGMTPKQYRKTLVGLTNVVETSMCAKDWNSIDFSKIPSVASARYREAFKRNTTNYAKYVEKLANGDVDVKVNASAIFPYDVLRNALRGTHGLDATSRKFIVAQWNALPNYVGDNSVMPIVDVSGSMGTVVSGTLSAMDVAVSLGLYFADKNKGAFNGMFLAFSTKSQVEHLTGDVLKKIEQMKRSAWDMSTNLHAAFENILKIAVDNSVPEEEMPKTLLIMSDMQFNQCTRYDDSAMEMIARKYENAGYKVPQIVFWNIASKEGVPVKFDQKGVALISGYSVQVAKAVMEGGLEEFTPEAMMLKTIMSPRYDLV